MQGIYDAPTCTQEYLFQLQSSCTREATERSVTTMHVCWDAFIETESAVRLAAIGQST